MKRALAVGAALAVAGAGIWLVQRDGDEAPAPAAPPSNAAPQKLNAVLTDALKPQTGTGTIRGRVVRKGEPVAGATVTATQSAGNEAADALERRGEVVPVARTTSGADGTFELSSLGPASVWLWADRDGTAVAPDVAVGAEGVELELGAGQTVSGRIVIDEGAPAPGAWVTLVYPDHPRFFDALAGPDGRFTLGALPVARYAVVAGAPGLLPARLTVANAAPQDVTIALHAPRAVTGTVTQAKAKVAGVPVHLGGDGLSRDVTTGSDGAFRFGELPAGEYHLTATRGDQAAFEDVRVDKKADPRPVELELEPAAVIVGHVRGSGRPLDGVRVALRDLEARTGANGAYRLLAWPSRREHVLEATVSGWAVQRTPIQPKAGEQTVDFDLSPEALIQGDVVDEAGAPIVGAKVHAFSPDDRARGADAATLERGTFSLTGLAADKYVLRVTHDDFVEAEAEAVAPTTGVRVRLAAGLSVDGVVVEHDGKPARAEVTATRNQTTAPHVTRTDAQGAFRSRGLAPGNWFLRAQNDGGAGEARVTLPLQDRAPLRIVLTPLLKLSGVTVDPDGKPLAGVFVAASPQDDAPLRRDKLPTPTESGDDGAFVIEGLEAGEYDLMAFGESFSTNPKEPQHAPAGATGVRLVLSPRGQVTGRVVDRQRQPIPSFAVDGHHFNMRDGRFAVNPLRARTLTFFVEGYFPVSRAIGGVAEDLGDVVMGEGRDVRVRVQSIETHQPLARADVWTVEAWSVSRYKVSPVVLSDENGVATLRGLPAGDTAIVVNHPTHQPKRVDVGATEREKLVELEKGPTLVVRVVDEKGRPAARAMVTLLPPPGGGAEVASSTDNTGKRRFEGMPAGRWVVSASAMSDEKYDPEAQKTAARGTVALTLPQAGEVTAEVKLVAPTVIVRVHVPSGPGDWQPRMLLLAPPELGAGVTGLMRFDACARGRELEQPGDFEVLTAPGKYDAVISVFAAKKRGSYTVPVEVTAADHQTLTLAPPAAEGVTTSAD